MNYKHQKMDNTTKDTDYSWIKEGVIAYYTNVMLMAVKCRVSGIDEEDENIVHIEWGEKFGTIHRGLLKKTHKEAGLR